MRTIILKCISILLSLCFLFSSSALATSIITRRKFYSEWLEASKHSDKKKQIYLLHQLKNYPLFPYVKFSYIIKYMDNLSDAEIIEFIHKNNDMPLSLDLKRRFIEALYKQKRWHALVQAPHDQSPQTKCYYYFAKYQQHPNIVNLEPIKSLWLTGKNLPSACDAVINLWRQTGSLNGDLILLRIELAMKVDNRNLARYLAKELPPDYKTIQTKLLALLSNPQNIISFAEQLTPSHFSKKIVMLTFPRFAQQNPDRARTMLNTIAKAQQLSPKQKAQLQTLITWQYFNPNINSAQRAWRDRSIEQLNNTLLIERRIRQALWENNDADLAKWLTKLSSSDQKKHEWQYWQSYILEKQGRKKLAHKMLGDLSIQRGFYGMVSAQKLNKPYEYDFDYPIVANFDGQNLKTVLFNRYNSLPIIKRISELLYWQNDAAAYREWLFFILKPENKAHLSELACFARLKGWGSYSVQATIVGKLWNNWAERFPLAYLDLFKQALIAKSLPLSFSLAISRQESALEPTLTSPAGARGLMQLMPTTACDIAHQTKNISYHSSRQLYEPKINIMLGIHFLSLLYQRYEQNRILSAIAYNAGPARADQWLAGSGNKLDVIAFIESLPFTETRNYVKNVLVNDYIYQLILKQKPNAFILDGEWQKRY